jgi:hypothetical protein
VLVFDGWVEYPYSQTMFAAWQAGAMYDAPTIEARDVNGKWRTVIEQFGYMAGMPRQASLPLSGDRLPAGCRQLRISSNLEIYFDRIRIVTSEPCQQVLTCVARLVAADVAEVGFARRSTFDQRRPFYDYQQRAPFWDTRHMAGFYSSFGPVLPLVASVDDASAIIGPGEEIRLRFEQPAEPPEAGWVRRYVLELDGWTKDMDLYTKDGETLEPIPARIPDRPALGREELHRQFNQRFRLGR